LFSCFDSIYFFMLMKFLSLPASLEVINLIFLFLVHSVSPTDQAHQDRSGPISLYGLMGNEEI